MSEIGLTITPNVATTQFVIDQNTIQITPDAIELSVYTQGAPVAGGSQGQLQYNNLNTLAGVPNTSVANGNLTFQNLPNLKISGGSNSYFLQTDGTGNLTWATGTVSSNGNGSANGANTQIQMTDGAGNFVGAAGFTFNYISNALAVPGDGVFTGNVTANNFIGNVIGSIANANYANFAGTIVASSQPNITTVGNLINLNVIGTSNANQFIASVSTGSQPLVINSTTKVANLNADLLDDFNADITVVANTIVVRDANANINGNNIAGTFVGNAYSLKENVSLITGITGTYNFDLINGGIRYATDNASGNVSINFRGNSTTTANSFIANGQSVIGTYLLTNGNTTYYVSNISIDGSAQTIKWFGNTVPISFSNSVMSYTFTIIKTSTTPTYTVLGTGSRYT